MSYHQEGDEIVIDGFDKGIGDSPYGGLTDMRNVNIISVPGEASVAFATTQQSFSSASGTFTVDTGTEIVTFSGGVLQANTAFTVTTSSALPSPLVVNTTYYTLTTGNAVQISLTPGGAAINLATTGTGTQSYSTINMGQPAYGCSESVSSTSVNYYVIDTNGRAWGNILGAQTWVYLNNTTLTGANGNGIVAWHGYLFVFRSGNIDYISTTNILSNNWTYGWKSNLGSTASNTIHDAFIGWQDDHVYICSGQYIDQFFQTSSATPFDPTNAATYTWTPKSLTLPYTEVSQCLTMLGSNLMIGGVRNLIYPWDRFSTGFGTPIALAENNIAKLVTVNTNTYALVGNRGRIYITNGSQGQLFKKLPDHLSGTVEPRYTWGGLGSQRNQLYFGVSALSNAGTALSANNMYGGLWAIDLDTAALRRVNELSYATYAGIATVILSSLLNNTGYALFIGWDSGASTYGIDFGTSNPYTGGQSIVVSDLIPVGTFLRKRTFEAIEYKLSMPLVSGETIQIKIGSNLNDYLNSTMTSAISQNSGTTTDSYVSPGQISGYFSTPVENQQWLLIQATLTSTNSTPSFCRLQQLRIRGTPTP